MVADLVRGSTVPIARNQLAFALKRSASPLKKLLDSAVKNATNSNQAIQEKDLFISEIRVDEGPKLKRYRPVSRGRTHPIQKKTSHVTLILSEKPSAKPEARNTKSKTKVRKIKITKRKQK